MARRKRELQPMPREGDTWRRHESVSVRMQRDARNAEAEAKGEQIDRALVSVTTVVPGLGKSGSVAFANVDTGRRGTHNLHDFRLRFEPVELAAAKPAAPAQVELELKAEPTLAQVVAQLERNTATLERIADQLEALTAYARNAEAAAS